MKPITTIYTLSAKIPQKLKFIFVSDLHGCENAPILEAIKNSDPDAILVGGDFIHDSSIYESGLEFLRLSASLYPTLVSLGNHECRYSGDIRAEVIKSGATLLDDSYTDFRGISIGGLSSCDSESSEDLNVDWICEFDSQESFKLLLCHKPEYYEEYVKPTKIDLTLSGHAHGGQWRFFGRGVYAPGQGILPKYTSGMYDSRLIVGRGLGNPHIVPRINNGPEIVVIDIKPLQ